MRAFDINEMKTLVNEVETPYDLLREGGPE